MSQLRRHLNPESQYSFTFLFFTSHRFPTWNMAISSYQSPEFFCKNHNWQFFGHHEWKQVTLEETNVLGENLTSQVRNIAIIPLKRLKVPHKNPHIMGIHLKEIILPGFMNAWMNSCAPWFGSFYIIESMILIPGKLMIYYICYLMVLILDLKGPLHPIIFIWYIS